MQLIKSFGGNGSFTVGIESSRQVHMEYGYSCSAFGIAVLFYKPQTRLSISFWGPGWSKNIRLYGPKKLSWEK